MIQVNGHFLDSHGILHTNPIIVVKHARYSSAKNYAFDAQVAGGSVSYQSMQGNAHQLTLNFHAVLYRDLQAMQEGKHPLTLRGKNGVEHFAVPVERELAPDEVVAECESWISANLLAEGVN